MASLAKLNVGGADGRGDVLLLGAHCDDIEIGCGATLVDLAGRTPGLKLHVVIFCSNSTREEETRAALRSLLGDTVDLSMEFGGFDDGFLPYNAEVAKKFLISKTKSLSPDLAFTHCRNDLHQDHRFISEITYQVLRSGLILEMEIPKYDGDMGRPNVYFPVSEGAANRKISTLMTCYPSQLDKHWFNEQTYQALLRLRGLECKSRTGMAEAFYASKIIIS